MKYLMQREGTYLRLLNEFNGKVITYMVSMFSKEEPQVAATIKDALLDYGTSYMECYDHDNTVLNLKMDALDSHHSPKELKNELAELLLTLIPKELFDLGDRIKEDSADQLDQVLT